jgi:uncharacterized protein (TIGR03083 family)
MSTAASPSPSIAHLELLWQSIDELCSDLTEDEWRKPTGCPGWTIQDQVAHLIDYEASALGRARPDHKPGDLAHTKNAMGESNEVGVDYRRGRQGDEVLAELREVAAARSEQLRGLTAAELAQEITTPAGPGTVGDMLTLRVMDTWSHEQDIRRALGRAGHEAGPAVEEAVGYFARFLPLIVGKRAAAPDGALVVFDIGGVHQVAIEVLDGRATVTAASSAEPTVTLSLAPSTFAALVGGRSDVPDNTVIVGDQALGQTILSHLAFLP